MTTERLLENSYRLDEGSKVWLRKDAAPFHYSDGDKTETEIGKLLEGCADRSVLSDELKPLQTNWPTTYYFSANRSNLLRPLQKKLLSGARVLELGCGMGAISRYLGENALELVAVEGSQRRGSIAALRLEDLPNAHVLIDNINNLPAELGKFDVVTLIGVLEYARRYGGKDAELRLLQMARSFLKPDGALVLAIENKLGLKYLGGIPEDHLQRSWLGITNGYRENNVCTWSRKELLEKLHEAGFNNCAQFIALPDYKLPTTIITPRALKGEEADLDVGAILNNTRRLFEPVPLFNAAEAWQSALDAGLLEDLADSLCFVATVEGDAGRFFEEADLVNHYGNLSSLSSEYAKQVNIRKEGQAIEVRREKLAATKGMTDGEYYQQINDEHYISGPLLISRIRKIAMRPDWTLEEFFAAFMPWVELLKQNMDESGHCDGALLDLTPFNIIVHGNEYLPIDLEWVSRKKLSLAYLIYRGFSNTLQRIQPLRRSSRHNIASFIELFNEFVKRLNLPPEMPVSADYLWWQEVKFMKYLNKNSKCLPLKDFKLLYMP